MTSEPAEATQSYGPALRGLHWLTAAAFFLAIALGLVALELTPGEPLRVALLTLHKSLGVTAFVLFFPRVLLRLLQKAPAYAPPLGAFTHAVAGAVHLALYALILAMPLSGYLHSAAGRHNFSWFWLVRMPNLAPPSEALDRAMGNVHYALAIALGLALAAHIGAALWHALVVKDGVLTRMWPGLRP